MKPRQSPGWLWITARLAMVSCTLGCARSFERHMSSGDFGGARAELASSLSSDPKSRDYMIDRMRLAIFDIADGNPDSPERNIGDVYQFLRTQGVNSDLTVAAVVVNENVKRWKGEPFEQAMMFAYTSIYLAMRAEWDNARAAAINSLFLLHDFGANPDGKRKSSLDVATAGKATKGPNGQVVAQPEPTYSTVNSNFAIGYMLAAVANRALAFVDADRQAEAHEHLEQAVAINSDLASLAEQIESGDYNTVLVVTYGLGPTKYGYGPDRACAAFDQKRGWIGSEPIVVSVNGGDASEYPVVTDLNTIAKDLMWNNLEDVRLAKSAIGTAAVGVGVGMMGSGNNYVRAAGAMVAVVGLATKASAAADTRHCEVLPQRVYVVPIHVTEPNSTVSIQVGGDGFSKLLLPAICPPIPPERIQLRLVCIPPTKRQLLPWMTSGVIVYANDSCDISVEGDELPYILGGRCVRKPTEKTLAHYHSRGKLIDMTLNDLLELYRAEQIALEIQDENGVADRHILEGGRSMETPLTGTIGFLRLFCQQHKPYRPRSPELIEFRARLEGKGATAPAQQ